MTSIAGKQQKQIHLGWTKKADEFCHWPTSRELCCVIFFLEGEKSKQI